MKICKGDKSPYSICILHQARPVWLIVFFECVSWQQFSFTKAEEEKGSVT